MACRFATACFVASLLQCRAHPSPSVPILPVEACEAGNVTFFSYHVHVLFDVDDASSSCKAALEFQQTLAEAFNISIDVEHEKCDDVNTTHGISPSLCMIDDTGNDDPFNASAKHCGSPFCPFLQGQWAVFVPADMFEPVVTWVMQHRGVLDVLVHPNSGCEIYDHRNWPMWGGKPQQLDLTCMHYDCPGCSIFDCRARTYQVLDGQAERCGLVRAQGETRFSVKNSTEFCSTACAEWMTNTLPLWAAECPSNCDLVVGDELLHEECLAHVTSRQQLAAWSKSMCVDGEDQLVV